LDFPRIYVWCDVTNEADVAKVAEIALNAGGARILVNCAWIGSTTDTVDTDQATSDRVFEVNMKGTFLMCRALLPQMLNPGNGSLEQLKKRQPLSRLGTADEIAAAVTFLAGPQSSFTTGSIFTIDDGMMAA
jgi:3-oxoacyl-[acyl-carrier protein] reductase